MSQRKKKDTFMKLARSYRQMSQFGSNQFVLIRVNPVIPVSVWYMSPWRSSARFLHFSGGVLPFSSYGFFVLFKLTEFDEIFEGFQKNSLFQIMLYMTHLRLPFS